jgi:hypothetical protein
MASCIDIKCILQNPSRVIVAFEECIVLYGTTTIQWIIPMGFILHILFTVE